MAGHWPRLADLCSRERATDSSWHWMRGPGRPCGPRTIRPRRLPVRSATKSAASSTSRCLPDMAAPSFSSRASLPPRKVMRSTVGCTSQARWHGAEANAQSAEGPGRQAARHRGQRRRLQSRRSPLRWQLHLLPRRCGGDRGVLPDLRRSPRLQDAVAWRRVVVDGELAQLGMPRFGKYVSAEDAELIRAYVARQAAMLYTAEAGRQHP